MALDFDISFTESKFNESLKKDHAFNKKLLIIFKTYVLYLCHRFINQKCNLKMGAHIFTKIKNTDVWNKKKKFQLFNFRSP